MSLGGQSRKRYPLQKLLQSNPLPRKRSRKSPS